MNFEIVLASLEVLVQRDVGLEVLREHERQVVYFSSMLHFYWSLRSGRVTPAGQSPLPANAFDSASTASYQLTTSLSARSLDSAESLSTLLKTGSQTKLNFDSLIKFYCLKLKNALGEVQRDSMLLMTPLWINRSNGGLDQGLYICSEDELLARSKCFSSEQIQSIRALQGFMLDFDSRDASSSPQDLRDRLYRELARKRFMIFPFLRRPKNMELAFFRRIISVRRFLLASFQRTLDAQFAALYVDGMFLSHLFPLLTYPRRSV